VVSQVEQLKLPAEAARNPVQEEQRADVRWAVLGLVTLELAWVAGLAAVGYELWMLV